MAGWWTMRSAAAGGVCGALAGGTHLAALVGVGVGHLPGGFSSPTPCGPRAGGRRSSSRTWPPGPCRARHQPAGGFVQTTHDAGGLAWMPAFFFNALAGNGVAAAIGQNLGAKTGSSPLGPGAHRAGGPAPGCDVVSQVVLAAGDENFGAAEVGTPRPGRGHRRWHRARRRCAPGPGRPAWASVRHMAWPFAAGDFGAGRRLSGLGWHGV